MSVVRFVFINTPYILGGEGRRRRGGRLFSYVQCFKIVLWRCGDDHSLNLKSGRLCTGYITLGISWVFWVLYRNGLKIYSRRKIWSRGAVCRTAFWFCFTIINKSLILLLIFLFFCLLLKFMSTNCIMWKTRKKKDCVANKIKC